jgi:hypothetical protein
MDHRLLPPSSCELRLEAGQTLLGTARAGTWLQVRRGVVVVQPAPRWLGDCMVAPAHRLVAGAGIALDEDGWWRLAVDAGPAVLQCLQPVDPPTRSWLARGIAALREVTRRRVPS